MDAEVTAGGATAGHRRPSGQELGEVAHAAQLELLDGPVAAAEHLGGLGDGEALQEPHDQALLLLGRQLA